MTDRGGPSSAGRAGGIGRSQLPAVPDEGEVAALRTELAAIRSTLDDAERRAGPVVPPGRHRTAARQRRLRRTAVAALLAGVLGVVALALPRGSDAVPSGQRAALAGVAAAGGPAALGTDVLGTDVLARIGAAGPAGAVVVQETAVLARPAATITLTLPDPADLPSSRLRAPSVQGLRASSPQGPLTVRGGAGRWTVTAEDGTPIGRLTLRYRLDGAVVAPGGDGRALVVVTPLTAGLSRQAGGPVLVRTTGARVRQATCLGAPVAEQLCGTRSEQGWTARIPASSPVPFVVLQVDR